MMKFRYSHILIAFVVIAMLSMCKKDLGSYKYKEIAGLSIDTVGSSGPFTIKQYIQELVINPKVTYTGNKMLDYYWIWGASSNDTLSREKNLWATLNWPISSQAYTLTFKVVERETGNMAAVQYKVTITGSTGLGILIGHERDGTADVSLINTPNEASSPIIHNIHETVNGYRLPGKVTGLGSLGEQNMVMFTTDQAASMMDYDGMTQRFANREIFGLLNPSVFKPEAFGFHSSNLQYLINNGQLYHNRAGNLTPGLMTERIVTADGSNYRLSPQHIKPNLNPGLFFDELGKRFLWITSTSFNTFFPTVTAASTSKFSLDNIDRKFLYAQRGYNLYPGGFALFTMTTVYAFFADNGGGPGRYLYVFGMDTPETPDFALVDISTAPDIQDAVFYDVFLTAPIVYYVANNKLHVLYINPGGNSYVYGGVQYTAPAGEEISCISLPSTNPTSRLIFYIATYNPTSKESKVQQFSVANGTGIVSSSPSKTWTGFGGKVTQMAVKWY